MNGIIQWFLQRTHLNVNVHIFRNVEKRKKTILFFIETRWLKHWKKKWFYGKYDGIGESDWIP